METLKQRLIDYYMEYESDYDLEETKEVLDILEKHDDYLSNLKDSWDKTLLLRLINDEELYNEVDEIGKEDY